MVATGLEAERQLLSRGPKDIVPERRADAVSHVIILEMMAEMILLEPKQHASRHDKMVRRVMEHVIADVTKNQTCEHSRGKATKN